MKLFRDTKKYDLVLMVLIVCLALTGLLILYSSSSHLASRWTGRDDYYFWKQGGWMVLGILFMLAAMMIPEKLIKKLALPGIVLSLILLILVFVPGFGHSVSSSRDSFQRWLNLGVFTFQPSEFAKIAMVVYLARVISQNGLLVEEYDLKKLGVPVVLLSAQLLAIVAEPQYGTTLCMIGVIILMVYISGFPFIRLLMIFAAMIPLMVILVVFWEYRFERIYVWLDPGKYRYSGGYQLVTSFRAFQEGSWFGGEIASGFAHRYLTFGHTDFVLALFSEDFGVMGIFILFLMYSAVLWRAYFLIRKMEISFAFILGAGIIIMLFSQLLLNLFVVTGLLPTTGVSLPFLSYGGSSLIVSFIFSGLLLNITAKNSEDPKPEFKGIA